LVLAAASLAAPAKAQSAPAGDPTDAPAPPPGDSASVADAVAPSPNVSAGPAEAEFNDANDIVITAQRRTQNLQDVGIAVAAYGGEQLRTLGVVSSVEVAKVTPGVFISANNGGQTSQFSIRGVTQNEFADSVEGPVAVYVDEGYVPNLQGQSFGLFDIERVEVLKGPQGTLFGRNATGGLVHFVINKPTRSLDGFVDLTYGSYNQTKIEAAVGGPLGPTLSARASFYWNRHDGILDNIYPGDVPPPVPVLFGPALDPCCSDLGNDDTLGGRLQLQWEPTDALSLRAVGSAYRSNTSIAPYNQVATIAVIDDQGRVVGGEYASETETRTAIGPGGANYTAFAGAPLSRRPGADWFGFVAPDGERLETAADFARGKVNRNRAYNASLHVDYDLGDITISSVTDWKKLTKDMGIDADAGPTNLIDVWADAKTESISQELRAFGRSGNLDWTVGAYFLEIDVYTLNALIAPRNSIFAAGVLGIPQGADLANVVNLTTTTYSAYAQIEYQFAPKWTVVLGGRIIQEKQDFDFVSNAYLNTNDYGIEIDTLLFPLQPGFADKRSTTLWAGKAQLEFRPNDDVLVYAGVNRGVKGGNFNSKLADGSPPLSPDQIPYKAEVLLSYEAGLKASFADGRAQFNASAFYYDYSDYQAFTFQNVSGFVQNRDGRTYGVEASISAQPVEGLNVAASIALLDAKVKDLQVANGVFVDVEPAFTPDTQMSGTVSYRIPPMVAGGEVTFGVTGSYVTSFYQNIRNFNSHKLDGYEVFDFRVTWENPDGFSLTGFVNNIFDKRYNTTGFDLSTLCGCSEAAYGRPQWFGATASYKF
jgi:iron complex outermembrane receptor protein